MTSKKVVNKLIPDSTGKGRGKAFQSIYLFHDVFVSEVKVPKPTCELRNLTELHGEGGSSGKLLGRRQVLKLNELLDMSPQSKNLLIIQTLNGDKFKKPYLWERNTKQCWVTKNVITRKKDKTRKIKQVKLVI